jgi:hypothetical protein
MSPSEHVCTTFALNTGKVGGERDRRANGAAVACLEARSVRRPRGSRDRAAVMSSVGGVGGYPAPKASLLSGEGHGSIALPPSGGKAAVIPAATQGRNR